MSDYLGPLTLLNTGVAGTYQILTRKFTPQDDGTIACDLTISVEPGTRTGDALTAAVEALRAACDAGGSYAHFATGATYPVVYKVADCRKFEPDEGAARTALAYWERVSITLTLAGQPRGALTTLYNAQAVNAPDALTLAALLGTRPTLLDVTIDDSSGNDMHSVWLALAPRVLTAAQTITAGSGFEFSKRGKWLIYASTLTWTSMSNGGATATMWSNDPRYTSSAAWQSAPIDTSGYPASRYKLAVRVKQAAGTGYVMDSVNMTPVAVTRSTPHIIEIGEVDLPVSDTAPGTASNLTIYVRSDGTNRFDIDAILVLPMDAPAQLTRWHPESLPTLEVDQLDVGPTGTWMDGVCDLTHLVGGPLRPSVLAAHTGTLIATEEPSGNVIPSDWGYTGAACTADTSRFKVVTAGATTAYWWYAATALGTPLVIPGEWYEVTLTRYVTARSAGTMDVFMQWQDVDGNAFAPPVSLCSVAATDGSPVNLELYAKAPPMAARGLLKFGHTAATGTSYWYNAVMRRCPLQLLVVAEDAGGALSSNRHAVAATVKYVAAYEAAR